LTQPEQLAAALERLDPRDRELLALSLRRRVPDEALGRLYDCAPAEVARRRTGAIDRLADDLGVKRGEDLGRILKALLEQETWDAVEGDAASKPAGAEFSPGERRSPSVSALTRDAEERSEPPEGEPRVYRLGADEADELPAVAPEPTASAVAVPEAVPDPAAPSPASVPADADAPPPAAADGDAPDPAPAEATDGAAIAPSEEPAPPLRAAPPQPVLEMLSDDAAPPDMPDDERHASRAVVMAAVGLAAVAGLIGFVGAKVFGGVDSTPQGGGGDGTRHFEPQERGPLGAVPFPSDPQSTSCYPTAYVRRKTTLYREPGGAKLIAIAAKTEWSSPRVLGVSSQREGWLAVTVPELPNGEVGWLPRAQVRVDCVRWSLHADLSKRLLYVRKDGRTVRKMTVAIGSREHPTPEGRFAVTDRLRVSDKNSPYGCCVLALSGHQTKLPDDWPGGDRLAVHATTDLASIGKPVSLGCMRSTGEQVRWLIETIPLGAPIFIRA
jgi:L,D-transpeptidase catalytic domain